MKPTLRTERLVLRPLRPEDGAAMASVLGDTRRPDYLGERVADAAEHRRRIEEDYAEGYPQDPFGRWAMELREGGRVVGIAVLKTLEQGPEIEVGWHIDPDFWGRGLATESARALLAYAFDDLTLDSVIAIIDPRNERSRRVAERLNVTPDGQGQYYGYVLDRFAIDVEVSRAGAPPRTREK